MAILIEGRIAQLVYLLAVLVIFYFFIDQTRKGKLPQIRRLAALDALPEIVGRCTELGRPLHMYVTGYLNNTEAAQVSAALTICSETSKIAARVGVEMFVSMQYPELLPIVEETIRIAYQSEGKGEAFKREQINLFPGYSLPGGVASIMQGEQCAGNVMVGAMWYESLIVAESASIAGAMQVGGTANTHQIPFVALVCDYSLIGEELVAAGAYISKEPILLASVSAQDFERLIAVALLILGVVLAGMNSALLINLFKI